MLSRKNIFIKLLFSFLMVFGAQAHADKLWHAKVWYIDSSSIFGSPISIGAPSANECGSQLQDALDNPPPGKAVIGFSPCTYDLAHLLRIPDDIVLKIEKIKWPYPPWPYYLARLSDILQPVNPAQSEKIRGLIYKYNIDAYSEEIINLQQQYDLDNFVKEFNELQQNISRNGTKNKN